MKQLIIAFLFYLMALSGMRAQNNVLQLFNGKDYIPVEWNDISELTFETEPTVVNVKTTTGEIIDMQISEDSLFPSGSSIPLVEITTEDYLTEIPNKTDYQKASFNLCGFDVYENIEKDVNIRGRGNSSWSFPKKPYRLKFDKKVSLCGLPSAKSYVLLANYTDYSMTQFALATKIGQMLGLPFTNQVIPVDVILNGIYKGTYLLTNKPGINAGSVNIDEDNSIMWELDVTFDEEFQFMSPILNIPVMAVDPDLTQQSFEIWKNDFIEMERAAVARKAADIVDMDILARYVLVYEIMENGEIGFPKSVKLYKSGTGKYCFGPIWDFDTSMGKVWEGESYSLENINKPVWKNSLINCLAQDSQYQEAIRNYWIQIRETLPELLEYIDQYSNTIYNSAQRNSIIWPRYEDFELSISKMKNWLTLRFQALDNIY